MQLKSYIHCIDFIIISYDVNGGIIMTVALRDPNQDLSHRQTSH